MKTPKKARKKARKKAPGKVRSLIRISAAGLAVAAITRELRRPKSERTWHGSLGKIPYDFRIPSAAKLKRSFWAPDDSRILVPRAFGVGWSINVSGLKNKLEELEANSAGKRARR